MAGAILLFLLKRNAYICFLSAFILGIITTVFHIFFKNWLEVIGGAGLVGAAIGWSISIAIILYSKKLIKKEILK